MSNNSCINITEAIKLINKKKTTIEELCTFLFSDIKKFQEERESFYLKEFETKCKKGYAQTSTSKSQEHADEIYEMIQKDTKEFSLKYANNSIDEVLDAINNKKFKTKLGYTNLLVLLTSMKELNEES